MPKDKYVSGKKLDKQVKTNKKIRLLEFIEGAIENALAHKDALKKLLEEETEDNTDKKKKDEK